MESTPNLGLEAWDLLNDDFDHSQLANNWVLIDNHDHTPGRGLLITTAAIALENVTTALIAKENITTPLIAKEAVETAQLKKHAVTREILAEPSVYTTNIANQQVTYEKLDPTVLPLGSVIAWYRESGATNLPGGGWEICDGRLWSEITNSLGYSSGRIPDMRNSFALGADINGAIAPGIGVAGGKNTQSFAHFHNVNPHAHSVPPHSHGINPDGNHSHLFLDPATGTTYSVLQTKLIHQNSESPTWNVLHFPDDVIGENDSIAMEFTGLHSHGAATATSSEFSTGFSGSATDTQLGTIDMRPQYVSLLYIMRVR